MVAQQPVDLGRIRRLGVGEAGKLEADRRRDRRLVRAALAREADPRRGAGDHEARAVVQRVDQGVEPAADERVVDRPDRHQQMARVLVGEAELREQQEEVHLADPELDVLARGSHAPAQRVPLDALLVLAAVDAHAVDPAAEVRRHGDVGSGGDEAARHVRLAAEIAQHAPERLLRRRAAHWHVRGGQHGDSQPGRRGSPPIAHPCGRRVAQRRLRRSLREAAPLVVARQSELVAAGRPRARRSASPSGSADGPRSGARTP